MSEWVLPIVKYILTILLVGGGLWKGLEALAKVTDAISNAFKLRAEAAIERRRLEDEQIKTGYFNALEMLKVQGERIDALHEEISVLEERYARRENGFRSEIDRLSNEFELLKADHQALLSRYSKLEADHLDLQSDYESLRVDYDQLKKDRDRLLARIRKIERSDTGPLKEV